MGTKKDPGRHDCYDRAYPDEPLFVLRAKDYSAPDLVRHWAHIRMEKAADIVNESERSHEVDKIVEALRCARQMERWRREYDSAMTRIRRPVG